MSNYPFIRFTICFIAGILISSIVNIDLVYSIPAVAILFTLVGLSTFRFRGMKFPNIIRQLLLYLLIIGSSIIYSKVNDGYKTEYPFNHQRLKDITIEGKVSSMELTGEKYMDFNLEAEKLIKDDDTVQVILNLLCKLKSNVSTGCIKIGDFISVKGTLRKAREQRNPYEFDFNKYLNSIGISGLFYINSIKDISIIDSANYNFSRTIYSVRCSVAGKIHQLYSPKTAALLKGLLLADRSGIDYDTKEAFVNSGVIHVLAVSGLHVGYIALIFLFLFSRSNVYVKNFGTIFGLLSFVLITGAPTSVVRASIMAAVLILSNLSVRTYNSLNSLSLAAFIILVIDPTELFNPGFQLSFSAVLSIFIIYPRISKYINSLGINSKTLKGILLFMGVSLAAQIGTLPFTLHYFNKLSIVALAVNLLVIPLIGIIIALGITSLLFGSFWSLLGTCYAFTNELVSKLLFTIVDFAGSLNFSYFYIPGFSLYDGLIYYALLPMVFYYLAEFRSIKSRLIFVLLIAVNSIVYFSADNYKLLPDRLLSVVMIDIGQGDSFLVKFPDSKTALIDAGNASFGFDNGERVIYPLLRNLGINRINYGFISHMDADHYKGFESLVERNIIDTIYKPLCDSTVKHDIEFEELAREFNVPIKYYDRNLIKIGGARLYVLNDVNRYRMKNYSMNDRSGIMKLVYGSTSILFTGDAGKRIERDLVSEYGRFLKSDILKAGHHGSKTSTSREFLSAVAPRQVLISAGLFNRFNHPSPQVINQFKSEKIRILRTDLQRSVILQSDGHNLTQIEWQD